MGPHPCRERLLVDLPMSELREDEEAFFVAGRKSVTIVSKKQLERDERHTFLALHEGMAADKAAGAGGRKARRVTAGISARNIQRSPQRGRQGVLADQSHGAAVRGQRFLVNGERNCTIEEAPASRCVGLHG